MYKMYNKFVDKWALYFFKFFNSQAFLILQLQRLEFGVRWSGPETFILGDPYIRS